MRRPDKGADTLRVARPKKLMVYASHYKDDFANSEVRF